MKIKAETRNRLAHLRPIVLRIACYVMTIAIILAGIFISISILGHPLDETIKFIYEGWSEVVKK